jgi:hypothetical protein
LNKLKIINFLFHLIKCEEWGLGIGDWGLGIGDWAQSPIPNPQSPIPNPQSPIPIKFSLSLKMHLILNN